MPNTESSGKRKLAPGGGTSSRSNSSQHEGQSSSNRLTQFGQSSNSRLNQLSASIAVNDGDILHEKEGSENHSDSDTSSSSSDDNNDSDESDNDDDDNDNDNDNDNDKNEADNKDNEEDKAEDEADDIILQKLLDAIKKNTLPISEVEKIFKSGSTSQNICLNLHNLIIAAAGQLVFRGSTKDLNAVYMAMYNEYLLTFNAVPKMSKWIDKFFQLLPTDFNRDWPDYFKEYVEKNVVKGGTTEERCKKIGSALWSKFKTLKNIINNKLNKRYVAPEELKSGQNTSAMFDAAREAHWTEDILDEKLKQSDRNKKRYQSVLVDNDEQDTKKRRYRKESEATYDDNWFPQYWLAWAMFGLPGELETLTSLSSGGRLRSKDPLVRVAKRKEERRIQRELDKIRGGGRNINKSTTSNTGSTPKKYEFIVKKEEHPVSIEGIQNDILLLSEREFKLLEQIDVTIKIDRKELLQEQLDIIKSQKKEKKDALKDLLTTSKE